MKLKDKLELNTNPPFHSCSILTTDEDDKIISNYEFTCGYPNWSNSFGYVIKDKIKDNYLIFNSEEFQKTINLIFKLFNKYKTVREFEKACKKYLNLS